MNVINDASAESDQVPDWRTNPGSAAWWTTRHERDCDSMLSERQSRGLTDDARDSRDKRSGSECDVMGRFAAGALGGEAAGVVEGRPVLVTGEG
ncbi:MAG: hypothetical protein ACRDPA_02515, partial [Solirubrobacteraceae bacterium]